MNRLDEIELLLKTGNLGIYSYCEIEQVVLFSGKNSINYFTNVNFSSNYNKEEPFIFLTKKPIKVNKEYSLAISKYVISVDKFRNIFYKAEKDRIWEFEKKEVIIDDAFLTNKKFVPQSDPTGGQYNLFVPIEYGLYGSNFSGNYYLIELFSNKTKLKSILNEKNINKIQLIMKEHGLNYRLDKISDRVGNVVCKFNVEVLTAIPKKLGIRGIEFDFSSNNKSENKYCLNILQEHDGMIYKNEVINDFNSLSVKVESNQCKTTISVISRETGLTLFCGRFDYSVYSNYNAQISPPTVISQTSNKRILHLDTGDEIIDVPNIKMVGDLHYFIEMDMATKRKLYLDDKWFHKKGYIHTYTGNEHSKALKDIIGIINNNLLWDLEEIWIIDPYLTANDLVNTVLRCKKWEINIKAVTSYATIHSNGHTKEEMQAKNYDAFKQCQANILADVLGNNTDIKLEFRAVRGESGVVFHDRYIMLKYKINKNRVWALGASVNSIGKSHSTIQIIEAPEILLSIFNDMWNQIDKQECLIYKNY